MTPAAFGYHAPRTVADAIKLLGDLGPDAKLLAGGHSLLPMMKLRFAQPSHLIDLGKVGGPAWHRAGGHRDPHRRDDHRARAAQLQAAGREAAAAGRGASADRRSRRCATRARSAATSATATRATTIRPLMLALDASFVLNGAQGERVVKADGYFLGLYATLAAPGRDPDPDPHPDSRRRQRLVLQQVQAQDRRLRHRRRRGAAADEGRRRGERVDRADQRRAHAAEGQQGRGIPGRQADQRRHA